MIPFETLKILLADTKLKDLPERTKILYELIEAKLSKTESNLDHKASN